MQQHRFANKGFVTLISVLLVGVVGLVIALSLIMFGLGSSKTALVFMQSNQAKALSNACAEEALEQIRTSTSFTGYGSLSTDNGSCWYSVTGSAPNKAITAYGTVGTVTRNVIVNTSAVSPQIMISLWHEVGGLFFHM